MNASCAVVDQARRVLTSLRTSSRGKVAAALPSASTARPTGSSACTCHTGSSRSSSTTGALTMPACSSAETGAGATTDSGSHRANGHSPARAAAATNSARATATTSGLAPSAAAHAPTSSNDVAPLASDERRDGRDQGGVADDPGPPQRGHGGSGRGESRVVTHQGGGPDAGEHPRDRRHDEVARGDHESCAAGGAEQQAQRPLLAPVAVEVALRVGGDDQDDGSGEDQQRAGERVGATEHGDADGGEEGERGRGPGDQARSAEEGEDRGEQQDRGHGLRHVPEANT
jgi:hypothetical protein